jgi:hypothetical protein
MAEDTNTIQPCTPCAGPVERVSAWAGSRFGGPKLYNSFWECPKNSKETGKPTCNFGLTIPECGVAGQNEKF